MKGTWLTITWCALPLAAFADEVADSCTACHKGALTLEKWESAPLAARLIEMREGRAMHVVPLPRLSDEQLEALAKVLAGD